jgi:hypothetical protein
VNIFKKLTKTLTKKQQMQEQYIDIMAPFEKPPAYHYDWVQYSGKN